MEKIVFEIPQAFVPDPIHVHILQAVADHQGCHITDVVRQLLAGHSENSVRSAVRLLLAKRYLDGGKSNREIILRLTSSGRILLDRTPAC
jgi:DNA-binding transcriptional regulator PaaX